MNEQQKRATPTSEWLFLFYQLLRLKFTGFHNDDVNRFPVMAPDPVL